MVKEKDLQKKAKPTEEEENELEEDTEDDETEEVPAAPKAKKLLLKKPEGFALQEVPTAYGRVITFNGEAVDADDLLVRMANALKDAGVL